MVAVSFLGSPEDKTLVLTAISEVAARHGLDVAQTKPTN
jgi:hypothetical protein